MPCGDGSIDVLPNDEFAILGVTCYIQNDEQLAKVKEMSTDDPIVVKGKINLRGIGRPVPCLILEGGGHLYPVSGHITSQCCGSTEIELGNMSGSFADKIYIMQG